MVQNGQSFARNTRMNPDKLYERKVCEQPHRKNREVGFSPQFGVPSPEAEHSAMDPQGTEGEASAE